MPSAYAGMLLKVDKTTLVEKVFLLKKWCKNIDDSSCTTDYFQTDTL